MPQMCKSVLLIIGFWVLGLANVAQAVVPDGLPRGAAPDTLHTNLWLTEALMAEIVTAATSTLPPAPAAVRLSAMSTAPGSDLLQAVAARVLGDQGYDLYLAEDDSTRQGAVDYRFRYRVETIGLSYPDVGRTLGVWRRWVARKLEVAVLVEITEVASGRLIYNERVVRGFQDRVDDNDFSDVDSDVYDFTTAGTVESGWRGRMEEVVVLGTLAGLVAIYFANTGN